MAAPDVEADLFVVAGDVSRPVGAIEWAKSLHAPAVFVAGNHEFYGSSIGATYRQLRQLAEGSNVTILEKDDHYFMGVRFLGCTLWSDYRLFSSPQEAADGLSHAEAQIRDFTRINVADGLEYKFNASVSRLLFDETVDWLDQQFSRPHSGPTVVIMLISTQK